MMLVELQELLPFTLKHRFVTVLLKYCLVLKCWHVAQFFCPHFLGVGVMRGFDFGWGNVGKVFVVDVHFCNISDVSEGVGLCMKCITKETSFLL